MSEAARSETVALESEIQSQDASSVYFAIYDRSSRRSPATSSAGRSQRPELWLDAFVRLFALALAAVAVGCSPAAPTVTTSAPFSQTDIVVGTGTTAANGNTLTVGYTGWLFDSAQPNAQGAQFDTSTGFSFIL